MRYGSLNFTPYEGTFHDKTNALVAEHWDTETSGIRVYDDYSRTTTDHKMYWVEELIRNEDGTILVSEVGYQVDSF